MYEMDNNYLLNSNNVVLLYITEVYLTYFSFERSHENNFDSSSRRNKATFFILKTINMEMNIFFLFLHFINCKVQFV